MSLSAEAQTLHAVIKTANLIQFKHSQGEFALLSRLCRDTADRLNSLAGLFDEKMKHDALRARMREELLQELGEDG